MIIKVRVLLLSLAMIGTALFFSAIEAKARRTPKVFTCHFPKAGTVVIDTREPKASITVNGKHYPAQSGSYFYQSVDGDIAVMFGPGVTPKFWEYNGERDSKCRPS